MQQPPIYSHVCLAWRLGDKWTVQGGIKQVIVSVHPFEKPLGLYCTSARLPYGRVGCLTLIFKADLPLRPDWWIGPPRIHQAELGPWWMNMSFINRASPHEVSSFFTQPIYPSARDWLTMSSVQSAIMTSSLINLNPPPPQSMPGENLAEVFFFFGPVHVPVGYNCIRYLQALFLVLARGSWESFPPRYQHHSWEGSIGGLWEAKKQSGYWVEFSNECLVCPQGSIFRFCHWYFRQ